LTLTDGPFTEAKEIIGGFALITAKDRAEAVEDAQRYADLFEEVEVEAATWLTRVGQGLPTPPGILTSVRGAFPSGRL
jgi:hypothetical protein